MSEEELMDLDLDIVNLLNKRPLDAENHSYFYISVKSDSVATVGGGDGIAMMQGFGAILTREDNGGGARDAMLTAVIGYLSENKGQLKKFKKALKLLNK